MEMSLVTPAVSPKSAAHLQRQVVHVGRTQRRLQPLKNSVLCFFSFYSEPQNAGDQQLSTRSGGGGQILLESLKRRGQCQSHPALFQHKSTKPSKGRMHFAAHVSLKLQDLKRCQKNKKQKVC